MMKNNHPTLRDDLLQYLDKSREEKIMNDNMRVMRKLSSGGFTSS